MVDYNKHFKPTYDPDDWAYCKAVTKDDVKNIAVALLRADDAIKSGKVAILSKANSTIFKNSLSEEQLQTINSSIGQQIPQFELFASQGGFLFAWDN
jgi:hypothetical protein